MTGRRNESGGVTGKLLADCPLFAGLPAAFLDHLAGFCKLCEVPAGGCLYEAGAPIREAYILFSGSLQRTMRLPGKASKLIELAQGRQVLALGEIFGGERYASTCTAITSCLLVAIEARRLRETVGREPELASRLIAELAQRQCAIEFDVTGYHYGLNGAQRVLDYLLKQAGEPAGIAGETTVVLRLSKKTIAAHIEMTPESFSRNLRELSDSGVIVVEGRKIHIQNAALLDTARRGDFRRLSFARKRKGEGPPGAQRAIPAGALVNRCARLRVLSQRLAVAWGLAAAGVSPLAASTKLRRLCGEFERKLAELGKLDLAAGTGVALAAIGPLWADYRATLAVEARQAAAGQVVAVFEASEAMLRATDDLVERAVAGATTPMARYVNVAARDRMLSQRIGKFFLFGGLPALQTRIAALMPAACAEFEHNLAVLHEQARPLPEVAAQVEVVAGQWRRFVHALSPDLERAGQARHARAAIAECERLLRHVDTTVKLFERLSV